MRYFAFLLVAVVLAACSESPPPTLGSSMGPDSPATPPSETFYKPVMAGTAYHGVGSNP